MGGVINDIGKAGKAVVGEFTHLKAPVPPAPEFDWSLVENGIAADEVAQMRARREAAASDLQAQRDAKAAALEHEKAGTGHEKALTGQEEYNAEILKSKRDLYGKYNAALDQLTKIDLNQPDAKDKLAAAREIMKLAGEGLFGRVLGGSGLSTMGASTVRGKDVPAGTLDMYNRPVSAEQSYRWFNDKETNQPVLVPVNLDKPTVETDTSTVDDVGNVTHTSKVTGPRDSAPIKPAPMNLGGGGSGHSGSPVGSGSQKKEIGEEEYKMAANGDKIRPKLMDAANRYAVRHNLPSPTTVTPADRKSLGGLGNLEATFPDLEKYSSVLSSTVSRIKLQEIISQVTKAQGSGGALASLEGLIGAGVNAALVKSLTPDEQKFLLAYNQGREAVQTMRQFAGVSRSTQALYNAMAALIPNPFQTRDAAMAKQQIAALRKQIATARSSLGVAGGGSAATPSNALPPGGSELDDVAIPASSPR